MQELGNDMESLFRRAAESYPLKKGQDRWDEISSRLSQLPARPGHAKRILAILFLVSLSMLTALFLILSPLIRNNDPVPPTGTQQRTESVNRENAGTNDRKTNEKPENIRGKTFIAAGTGLQPPGQIRGGQSVKIPAAAPVNAKSDRRVMPGAANVKSNDALGTRFRSAAFRNDRIDYFPALKRNSSAIFSINRPRAVISDDNTATGAGKSVGRWYFGITGGPGFNSVDAGINRTGFGIGFLGGYRLGSRVSLEGGIYFTRNFYESGAGSFDQKAIAPMLTGGRELTEVHGSNKMLELPVNLLFYPGRHRRFFVSAGISSLLLTEESNWYLTSINGNEEMLYGEYRKRHPYFAAVAGIAAGYEKPLGRNTLRFQPYLQFPLQGVGVGDLRLISTGLHLGITRTVR